MLGIDTSKATLVATLADPATKKRLWCLQVERTASGISELIERTPSGTSWVIEPTGRYSIPVVQQGCDAGIAVLMAPTRQAKAFAQALHPRAKTDRIDSLTLAMMGLSQPLPAYPLKCAMSEQIDQLLSARKQMRRARTSLALQQKELSFAKEALAAAIAALDAQIQSIDSQLASLSCQDKDLEQTVRALRSVPGIGPVTAAALASLFASRNFATADRLVAYIGLDIGVRQSGSRSGQTGLSKRGDAELRRLLYLAAQSNLRIADSPFRQQYERERAKGLSSTAALVAVERKIATVCWSIARSRQSYEPSRVGNNKKATQAADGHLQSQSQSQPAPVITANSASSAGLSSPRSEARLDSPADDAAKQRLTGAGDRQYHTALDK